MPNVRDKTLTLTSAEVTILATCLHVAAEQFDQDAKDSKYNDPPLHKQFKKQAREARELHERVEDLF